MDWWLHAVLCVGLTVCIYGCALKYPLLYDDVAAVENNPDVYGPFSLLSIVSNDFWGTPLKSDFSHQSFRPLTVLSFRLFSDISRQRLLNTVLHITNTLLFNVVVARFTNSRLARTASLFFCLHPIHVETVIQLVGRAELLCGTFYLLCLLSPSYYLACLFSLIAMFCKEQGITALAVRISLDVIYHLASRRDPLIWRKLLISTMALISFLGGRLAISKGAPAFHALDNPARHLPFPFRQINFAYLALFNINIIINPHKQSCDYTFNSVPPIEGVADRRIVHLGLFALALCGAVAFLLRKAQDKNIRGEDRLNNNIPCLKSDRATITATNVRPLAALAMTVIPWLPASNLLFYVGFVIAERVLYLPTMGVCILIVIGYHKLLAFLPERAAFLRNALVVLYGCLLMKSSLRSRQWRNGVQLFGSAVRDYPENIKMWNSLGKAHELAGDFHLALSCFDKSLTIHNDIRAFSSKAKLLTKLNKINLAKEIYSSNHRAIVDRLSKGDSIHKEDVLFVVDFVKLLIKADAFEEAERIVKELMKLKTNVAEVYVAAGEVFYYLNRKEDAEQSYRAALAIEPRNADSYYNLGVILMEQGKTDKASSMFRECIARNSQHEPSKINLNVLSTNKQDSQMMDLYKDAMDALREGSYAAAESYLHQVLSKQPHHTSALYNLALLQTQIGKPPSASLTFLDRLLTVRPSHSKGLLLKANIVHKQLNDPTNAVELYARAYQVDHKLESALQALCDLSPSRAFSLGGNCDRHVDIEIPKFSRRDKPTI